MKKRKNIWSKARSTEEAPGGDPLAIEYQQQLHQYQQSGSDNAQANVAHAHQGHNSWPSPPLLL